MPNSKFTVLDGKIIAAVLTAETLGTLNLGDTIWEVAGADGKLTPIASTPEEKVNALLTVLSTSEAAATIARREATQAAAKTALRAEISDLLTTEGWAPSTVEAALDTYLATNPVENLWMSELTGENAAVIATEIGLPSPEVAATAEDVAAALATAVEGPATETTTQVNAEAAVASAVESEAVNSELAQIQPVEGGIVADALAFTKKLAQQNAERSGKASAQLSDVEASLLETLQKVRGARQTTELLAADNTAVGAAFGEVEQAAVETEEAASEVVAS